MNAIQEKMIKQGIKKGDLVEIVLRDDAAYNVYSDGSPPIYESLKEREKIIGGQIASRSGYVCQDITPDSTEIELSGVWYNKDNCAGIYFEERIRSTFEVIATYQKHMKIKD